MKLQDVIVRAATKADCPEMLTIINQHATDGLMLSKNLHDLWTLLPNFYVAEFNKEIVGCCGFKIWPTEGIEIISSAVKEEYHRQGIGEKLNKRCLLAGVKMGFKRFFVLTNRSGFYYKFGFTEVPKEKFSPKIYLECIKCSRNKSTDFEKTIVVCDEVAMIKIFK